MSGTTLFLLEVLMAPVPFSNTNRVVAEDCNIRGETKYTTAVSDQPRQFLQHRRPCVERSG